MIVELDNVHKSFFQGELKLQILKGVNFSLAEAETVAILGRSGSGKSTLLSLLSGLDRPDEGSIKYLGEAIENKDESEMTKFRSEHVGIVFQQFNLMSTLNAYENVALALEVRGESDIEQKVTDILTRVGLKDRLSHYPHQLSGGENQRVAIARAIVARPKLILADEPSGNLDAETGKQTMDTLFELVEQMKLSLILVTHDELLAKRCNKIVKLEAGALN